MCDLEERVKKGFSIYEVYKWLIGSYVLDFFSDQHWCKLPESLKSLKDLSVDQLIDMLDYERTSKTFVFPLSILALKKLFLEINVSRKHIEKKHISSQMLNDEKLMKIFWKNVKLKKRHEIPLLAQTCYDVGSECDCFHLVDIGSGLGHLSRILAYGFDFQMCAIEAQSQLVNMAGSFDKQFDSIFKKKYGQSKTIRHVNKKIQSDITSKEFLSLILSSFGTTDENFKFGIVGLHPCGDLGTTLLRLYEEIPNISFINIVGCCYMRLSTAESTESNPGFPISDFFKLNNYNLCYSSREIACHAIEKYRLKLCQGEHWRLKIHTYRATIEKILIEIDPQFRHIPLSNVKLAEDIDFISYCKRATSKLFGSLIDSVCLDSEEIDACLEQWNAVIIYYSLRTLFAPMIESLILYDRLLYLREKGNEADLIPAFQNIISPRMHVLQGRKLKK